MDRGPGTPSIRLVSFRGLWDKFAGPCTFGAYKRAAKKGVPFILDVTAAPGVLRELLDEGVLGQADVPVFLRGGGPSTGGSIPDTLDAVPGAFWIETPDDDGISTVTGMSSERLLCKCGYYLALSVCLSGRDSLKLPASRGNLILYESIDTIQSLEIMKKNSAVTDEMIEARFDGMRDKGAVFMKVSDLVERELWFHGARWVAH